MLFSCDAISSLLGKKTLFIQEIVNVNVVRCDLHDTESNVVTTKL